MSGKILPLKKPKPASTVPAGPWVLGEVFTRDSVAYELVTAGEIEVVELDSERSARRPPATWSTFSAMRAHWRADHVLVLRPMRPA